MHSCRKLVENVAFFKNLPLALIVRIVSSLRSEVYLINDVIVKANTPGNSMFFIATGTVAVFTNSGREVNFFLTNDTKIILFMCLDLPFGRWSAFRGNSASNARRIKSSVRDCS